MKWTKWMRRCFAASTLLLIAAGGKASASELRLDMTLNDLPIMGWVSAAMLPGHSQGLDGGDSLAGWKTFMAFVKTTGQDGWDGPNCLLASDYRPPYLPQTWRGRIWSSEPDKLNFVSIFWWTDMQLQISVIFTSANAVIRTSEPAITVELPPSSGWEFTINAEPVPEPSGGFVVLSGLFALLIKRRK